MSDPQRYFKDIIDVTRNVAEKPTNLAFWANHRQSPYIKTKPIHPSQKLTEKVNDGTHFSIDVIPNFELERKRKIKLMHDLYHANTSVL